MRHPIRTLLPLVLSALSACSTTSRVADPRTMPDAQLAQAAIEFQQAADIIRLRHAAYYAELIEEYRTKTGAYPLANDSGPPKWVYVAHLNQMRYTRPGAGYPHERVSFAEFIQILERGLGRSIDERYDPQFVPVNRPNFYTYVWADGVFYFTVHLYGRYPFANRRATDFSALVVTNRVREGREGISADSLLRDPAFTEARQQVPAREGFFIEREQQFIRDTKSRPAPPRERVTPTRGSSTANASPALFPH